MNSSLGFSELNDNNTSFEIPKQNKLKNKIKHKKIQQILESVNEDSDDETGLSNIYPDRPQINQSNNMNKLNKDIQQQDIQQQYTQEQDNDINQEGFKQLDSSYAKEYYNNYIPYYTQLSNNQTITGEKDLLIEKLNYMIELLEEQKEEKTGHISEELILYSFLGVFIIFVVDSFARAGKYVR